MAPYHRTAAYPGAGVKVEALLFTSLADRLSNVIVGQAKAWKADLIVSGTHGRHGVARALLGSDADQILRLSQVPVLLVRSAHPDAGAGSARCGGRQQRVAVVRSLAMKPPLLLAARCDRTTQVVDGMLSANRMAQQAHEA